MSERSTAKRKFWGWGNTDGDPEEQHVRAIGRLLGERFGCEPGEPVPPPQLHELDMPAVAVDPPGSLAAIVSADPLDRASHTYGKSFRDIVRALRRDFRAAPDLVAFPRDEGDVAALLDWCTDARLAAIPYGGGSSVVGGVEARIGERGRGGAYGGAVSIDLGALDRIVEIDRDSRAARIQAGIHGPALEDALRPHGLTLRHFPQSFEFSTLGGWIATRSGGHYATLYTHIDEFVESVCMLTPSGPYETRRLPGSGAGPSPDRLAIGSEGTLGIITEAWMRLQYRPTFRASTAVRFAEFHAGARAAHDIAQSGLHPSNLRLLDAGEALTSGAGDGTHAVLIIGFESADHTLDAWIARALECARDHGAEVPEGAGTTRRDGSTSREGAAAPSREGAAGAWRDAFLRAPYLRDALVRLGFISETFETAMTWDRFEELHASVTSAVGDALARVCGGGQVTCRFTHVYPDGPAPYFTVLAPGAPDSQLEQWDEIKVAASDALDAAGATITHHHAVGRDHRTWYDRQRPDAFAAAFRAAKRSLDPALVMNPGVLVDP